MCAAELQRHEKEYYKDIMNACISSNVPFHAFVISIVGQDTLDDNKSLGDSFAEDCRKTTYNRRWCGYHHLLAMANLLGTSITSVFPKVDLYFRSIMHAIVKPTRGNSCQVLKTGNKKFAILWSRETLDWDAAYYQPNHVVPICVRGPRSPTPPQDRPRSPTPPQDRPRSPTPPTPPPDSPRSPTPPPDSPRSPTPPAQSPPAKNQKKISSFFKSTNQQNTTNSTSKETNNKKIKSEPAKQNTGKPAKQNTGKVPKSDQQDTGKPAKQNTGKVPKPDQQNTGELNKKKPETKRKDKTEWYHIFPWLEKRDKMFFCKICLKANELNVFTSGKSSSDGPRKDDFQKHQRSLSHKTAVENIKQSETFEKKILKSYEKSRTYVYSLMRTLLVMAKAAIPMSKHTHLIYLQKLNGVDCFDKDVQAYTSVYSINELYDSLYETVIEELKEDIKACKYQVYGVEADEGTDSSNSSIVMVYIRFYASDGVKTVYCSSKELDQTTADYIHDKIKEALDEVEIDVQNVCGMGTDGASVMVGVHRGVVTQFKKVNRCIIGVHCHAHRLQKAAEKASKTVPYLVKYIGMLNEFAKSLKYSPKMKRILENCKSMTSEKANQIYQIFFTRWLSFSKSTTALANSISSVISTLLIVAADRGLEGRATLHGLATQMSNVKFILMTNFLADIMTVLARLNLYMQKDNVKHQDTRLEIQTTCKVIEECLTNPGPYMRNLYDNLPESPSEDGDTEYRGNTIKDTNKLREEFKKSAKQYVDNLLTHLLGSFPSTKVDLFEEIFSPQSRIGAEAGHEEEVLDKLKILATHFEKYVSIEETLEEYRMLRFVMEEAKYSMLNMEGFMKSYLHKNSDRYPNTAKLVAVGLTIPLTSVSCERGISAYNEIKPDGRSSQSVTKTHKLLMLYLNKTKVENFDLQRCFEIWSNKKSRRGMMGIMRKK